MKFRMRGSACSLAALSMFGAVPAIASAADGPYIGIEGGYNYENPQNLRTTPDEGLSGRFDAGYVGGLTFGFAASNGLRPELELDYRRNDIRKEVGPTAVGVDGYSNAYSAFANLWYDFKQPTGLFSVVHPYIGGGIGGARIGTFYFDSPATSVIYDRNLLFAFQGGAGIGFDITPQLTASVDYRYVQTERGNFASDNSGHPAAYDALYRANSALVGLRYSFGGPKPEPVHVAAPPPPPAYVPPPPPPPVDGDDDGDGVPNSRDKCPGTPKGFKVDADGCIIEQNVVLRAVNFEYNSDRLTQPAQETLDEIAKALIGQPELNVQIGGYTDSKGSAAYNLKLSNKRAASVRTYLIGKGVKSENLVSKGFGKAFPIASNATEEGRTENRRVEFVVLNKPPATVKITTAPSSKASKAAADGTEPKAVRKKPKK